MAITKNTGRQYPLVAYVDVSYADLTTGVAVPAIDIPGGAQVIRGTYHLSTVLNSGTSDAVVIQDNAGTPIVFVTDANAADATASTDFTIAAGGYYTTTPMTIDVKWTGSGTAPTTGAIRLVVEYILDDRANEAQPAA